MSKIKHFSGKKIPLQKLWDWWNKENISKEIENGEEITVIVGKRPPQKSEPKKLSKDKETADKYLKKPGNKFGKERGEKEPGMAIPGSSSELGEDFDSEVQSIEPPETIEEKITPPKWFLQKLKSILKDNTLHRKSGNKLYGDLDFKHLYKISTTNKVFNRKEIVDKKIYNIVLIVDCSGSMQGSQVTIAAKAASLLLRDFQKISNIMVLGFNRIQYVVKPFNVNIDEKDLFLKIEQPLIDYSYHDSAGGNHDHMALRVAHKEIMKQKGQKIIIILSDGEPACSGCKHEGCPNEKYPITRENCINALKEEINNIEKQRLPLLSIGIETAYVKDFYTNYKVIHSHMEIYEAIIELLDQTVRRLPINC